MKWKLSNELLEAFIARSMIKQLKAETELGQAQPKLELEARILKFKFKFKFEVEVLC